MKLPELSYGSIWLIAAGTGGQHDLSPLAVHALRTAEAVLHDPETSKAILDLITPLRYREAAPPQRAIERAIKLAQDGWRVVHLVEGDTMESAFASAIRFAERNIPFRIVPNAREPISRRAPLGLLLVRRTISIKRADSGSTLVLFAATQQSEDTAGIVQGQPTLDSPMSGLSPAISVVLAAGDAAKGALCKAN